MDGEWAPASYWRDVEFRSPGTYQVSAQLHQSDGKDYTSNVETVQILGVR